MPRRRFQRGRVFRSGVRNPAWVGVFREDHVQADGTIRRVQRKVRLGYCNKMSQRAAYAAFQPYLDAVNIAPPPPPKIGRTLQEAVKEWREQIAVNLKPSTVRAAESHLRQHLLPRLGELRLQELNARTVQAFVTTLAASGITRKTIENVLQTLFSILKTARLFGNAVPLLKRADLVLPRQEQAREVKSLDASQTGPIIRAAKQPYSTMFAVLAMTAVRAGEMLGLKVSDLDFSHKVIHVRRTLDSRTRKEQSTKTPGSSNDVPMPLALERRLTDYLMHHYRENPSGYLFSNRNGNPFSIGKVTEYGLWPVQDKLGIGHTGLHAFRHGAASELLEEGAPLTVVQRQLRHRDARTTLQKYGHVVGEAQRRGVDVLAEKIERFSAVDLMPSPELMPSTA